MSSIDPDHAPEQPPHTPPEPSPDEPPSAHSRQQSELDEMQSSPNLPELPKHELEFSFDSILNSNPTFASGPEVERVQKRASNVLKLSQENEKLNAELKAMTERLEAAERKRRELEQKMKGTHSGNSSS